MSLGTARREGVSHLRVVVVAADMRHDVSGRESYYREKTGEHRCDNQHVVAGQRKPGALLGGELGREFLDDGFLEG